MYHYNSLIIGGTLSAHMCAFVNQIPLIHLSTVDYCPYPWDYFPSEIDWSRFEFPNQDSGVITNCGVYSRGMQKLLLYTRFATIMGMSGLAPFAGDITKIEVDQENKRIRLTLNEKREVLLTYNKLYIFDSTGILWDLAAKKKNEWYVVTDWFVVHNSMRQCFDIIMDKENDLFVWRIFYYLSDRNPNMWEKIHWLNYIHPTTRNRFTIDKDLCAVSFLREEQLNSADFNENSVRLKIIRMAHNEGLKGRFNYIARERRYYRTYNIEFFKREIKALQSDLYQDKEDIKFVYWDDDYITKFALKYINHTNLTENINKKLFSGLSEKLATKQCPVQKSELKLLFLRRCYPDSKQLERYPKNIQKHLWKTNNGI